MAKPVTVVKHAVLWIDHHQAKVLHLEADAARPDRFTEHAHDTAQHRSEVRSQHEFFAEVCDSLGGDLVVLVAGSKTALSDFRHYVDKHRPQKAKSIATYETVDHPTDNQLSAMGRKFFER